MNINFKRVDIILSEQQESRYLDKIQEICRFLKDFCPLGSGDLELGRTTVHHQGGDVFYAKARLNFPAKSFYVEKTAESIDAAFDIMKNRLDNEIRQYKDKLLAERRRGGRMRRLMKSFKFWDKLR
ncbi:MAG: hypothetical protein A3J62_00525 [Candidatus Buchananbacteria bacterium RIFCSPHIGHO2_02_FULL_38_8]|uniref:Ribosomal subunit interface protein n=2 Tax=Candidatus Buchananiibacteriota TaxID=1817903 RepID=A0A1G1XVK0_9BACT|nr:MAG: hypothetical protein A2731_02240 [Candidatus Buchananbacteria bacterium RIFCSPHIGHO2_01_FULL_39_8]OGY47016.1 MAG: hypothetical protein A3J62_00525 [Candidatus Buchananbacteria bacterium RIFCSPHIGHO2_02_FULL_38_8]